MSPLTYRGYVQVYEPSHPLAFADGYVLEHRKIAWDLGLLTDRRDHVHHRNHDKADNRPENLEVMPPEQHASTHADEDGVSNQYGKGWPRSHTLRPQRSVRSCHGCDGEIGLDRRIDAKFCTDNCRIRTFKRNHR